MNQLTPFRYVVPVRHRWRWQVVEYTATVTAGPVRPDGMMQFAAAGPMTRTVHRRRFWLLRSANRYIRGLQEERSEV